MSVLGPKKKVLGKCEVHLLIKLVKVNLHGSRPDFVTTFWNMKTTERFLLYCDHVEQKTHKGQEEHQEEQHNSKTKEDAHWKS